MPLLTKMFTTIPSCRLHVLDNDTQEEMPHTFFKVASHVYPKNKVNARSCCKKYNFKNNNKCPNSVEIFSNVIVFYLKACPYLSASLNRYHH